MVVSHYFDYAATTPVDTDVVEAMTTCLKNNFGNPASQHAWGREAQAAVEQAKLQIARLIECGTDDFIFTSNATESINFALKGAFLGQDEKKHIISFATEHRATLSCLDALKKLGAEITLLSVDENGQIDFDALRKAIRPDTLLISVMHVNNELGVVHDVKKIVQLADAHGVWVHVDAAQSIGKLPFSVKELGAAMVTFSSHKMYGPKGIGALYVRRRPRVNLFPLLHGGFDSRGLRAGTLATHQIVGFGAAAQAVQAHREEIEKVRHCQQAFLKALSVIPFHLHAEAASRVPHIVNVQIEGFDNRVLFQNLSDYAFSKGSACAAQMESPSHALLALGVSSEAAGQSVRISFGRYSTVEASEKLGQAIVSVVQSKVGG